MGSEEVTFEAIEAAFKRCAGVLDDAGVPFLLAGGLAAWARGGPETRNDLDFVLRPGDAEDALDAFSRAGLETDRPPEAWLFKGWEGGVLVDLIFQIPDLEGGRRPVDDGLFERADDLKVSGLLIKVMSLEDLLATKLLAMEPNGLDYTGSLAIARSLREQVDWAQLRERTRGSPYAAAFFTLVEQLGVASDNGD